MSEKIKNFVGGVIPSPEDSRDYRRPVDGVAAFPYEFELPLPETVKNQGQVGACVACSASLITEGFTGKEMSEGFIYGYRPENYHQGWGMIPREACKTIAKYGGVTKKTMPDLYEVPHMTYVVNERFDGVRNEAESYAVASYIRLYSAEELKAWLMTNHYPVLVTHEHFGTAHAEVCFGWIGNNAKLRNSWGSYLTYHEVGINELYEMWGILPAEKEAFPDVQGGAWYEDAVKWIVRKGIMGGFPDGTFKPNDSLTRAQVAMMLYRQSGITYTGGKQAFNDVTSDKWFFNAAQWCKAMGIFNGDEHGNFNPDEPITRAQMAAVINRRFGAGEWSPTYPVADHHITLKYGVPGSYYCGYHTGVDFISNTGKNDILAVRGGRVCDITTTGSYGNRVVIDHEDGWFTAYSHLDKIYTTLGAHITEGEPIGLMGNTGNSHGKHLHFEVYEGVVKYPGVFPGTTRSPEKWLSRKYHDVNPEQWYFNDVNTCKFMGGRGGNLFDPNAPVTRAEAAAVFYRILAQ